MFELKGKECNNIISACYIKKFYKMGLLYVYININFSTGSQDICYEYIKWKMFQKFSVNIFWAQYENPVIQIL
jgi:hypothetical protein